MAAVDESSDDSFSVSRVGAAGPRASDGVNGDERGRARVRCRCVGCGAHVQAVVGMHVYGQCRNCGGTDLVPLAPLGRK